MKQAELINELVDQLVLNSVEMTTSEQIEVLSEITWHCVQQINVYATINERSRKAAKEEMNILKQFFDD